MSSTSAILPDDAEGKKDNLSIREETKPTYYWEPWNTRHAGSGDTEAFHCVPLSDLKPHLYSTACECKPMEVGMRYTQGGRLLPFYMHNSWDWRELDEDWFATIHGPEVDNRPA